MFSTPLSSHQVDCTSTPHPSNAASPSQGYQQPSTSREYEAAGFLWQNINVLHNVGGATEELLKGFDYMQKQLKLKEEEIQLLKAK